MPKILFSVLALMGAFTLGGLLARALSQPPPAPIVINNYPASPTIPSTMGAAHGERSFWGRWSNRFLDYYYPRSLVGNLIIGMHDPVIRSLSAGYLRQAWSEIKKSTASLSPEAAARLQTEFEPLARQTLMEVQDRLDQFDQ